LFYFHSRVGGQGGDQRYQDEFTCHATIILRVALE
jgi:hypothetical protein